MRKPRTVHTTTTVDAEDVANGCLSWFSDYCKDDCASSFAAGVDDEYELLLLVLAWNVVVVVLVLVIAVAENAAAAETAVAVVMLEAFLKIKSSKPASSFNSEENENFDCTFPLLFLIQQTCFCCLYWLLIR
jgi:hypothetical protein